MVIVLVGLAIIVGGLLAWVNRITAAPIAKKAEQTLADGICQVMGTTDLTVTANDTVQEMIDDKPFSFVIHKTADKSGQFLGAAVESSTMGFGGDLKVLVGFNAQGDILGYTILQSSETPGLGAKADKWFQKDGKGDIIGMNPGNSALGVRQDGGEVDAITASTITSRAFLRCINQAYQAYAEADDSQKTKNSGQHEAADGQTGASKQKGKDAGNSKQEATHETPNNKASETTDGKTGASKQKAKKNSTSKISGKAKTLIEKPTTVRPAKENWKDNASSTKTDATSGASTHKTKAADE